MRDLRKFARQTQNRLVIGLLALLFTVGLVLIYILYGDQAALLGLLCMVGILIPIFLTLLILNLIEKAASRD